jgi:SAM-dependent methyltransferase
MLFSQKFVQGNWRIEDFKNFVSSVPNMQDGRSLLEIETLHDLDFDQIVDCLKPPTRHAPFALLDFGAGNGTFLKELAQKYCKRGSFLDLYGLEIIESFEKIQEKTGHPREVDWLYVESGENMMGGLSSYFDLILSTRVLEYAPNPLKALEEIFLMLKPGGRASIIIDLLDDRGYAFCKPYLNFLNFPEYRQKMAGHLYLDGIDLAHEFAEQRAKGFNISVNNKRIDLRKTSEAQVLKFDYELIQAPNVVSRKYQKLDEHEIKMKRQKEKKYDDYQIGKEQIAKIELAQKQLANPQEYSIYAAKHFNYYELTEGDPIHDTDPSGMIALKYYLEMCKSHQLANHITDKAIIRVSRKNRY